MSKKSLEESMNKEVKTRPRKLVGKIVSTSMAKTVVVEIDRVWRHPVYKKAVRRSRRIMAETNNLELKLGDRVKIVGTRPISRHKHFRVSEKLT